MTEVVTRTKRALLSTTKTDFIAHFGPLKFLIKVGPSDLRLILQNYIRCLTLPFMDTDSKMNPFKEACSNLCLEAIKEELNKMKLGRDSMVTPQSQQEYEAFKTQVQEVYGDQLLNYME